MQTKIEAPAPEPLSLAKTAVTVSGVSRAYQSRRGAVSALQELDLRVTKARWSPSWARPAAASRRCSS